MVLLWLVLGFTSLHAKHVLHLWRTSMSHLDVRPHFRHLEEISSSLFHRLGSLGTLTSYVQVLRLLRFSAQHDLLEASVCSRTRLELRQNRKSQVDPDCL